MTAAEAAEYLGVGVEMLARYEKEGLVTYRLGDGPKAPRRWYRSDLDDFVRRAARNRCSPESPGDRDAAA